MRHSVPSPQLVGLCQTVHVLAPVLPSLCIYALPTCGCICPLIPCTRGAGAACWAAVHVMLDHHTRCASRTSVVACLGMCAWQYLNSLVCECITSAVGLCPPMICAVCHFRQVEPEVKDMPYNHAAAAPCDQGDPAVTCLITVCLCGACELCELCNA